MSGQIKRNCIERKNYNKKFNKREKYIKTVMKPRNVKKL